MFKSVHLFFLKCKEYSLTWQLSRFLDKNKQHLNKNVKGCTLEISAVVDSKKEYLNKEIKKILKECHNDKDEILEYIKSQGTQVLDINNIKDKMNFLNENEGLILPAWGVDALKINFVLFKKIGLKSPAMFVVDSEKTDIYILIQQFHKWYYMRNGFKGYDRKSAKYLKMLESQNEDIVIAQLNNDEITLLRQAVARDIESISFVEEYARENAGSKKALFKIKNGNSAVI